MSKISKENLTNLADWIKEKSTSQRCLSVVYERQLENVIPGRARRDLWEVGRGSQYFSFDFIEFEVCSRQLKMRLIFGRKYSIKYLIVKIVNMQTIIETIKMDEGSREIIKKRWKDDILCEENLGIIKSRPGGLETRHQIYRETKRPSFEPGW